MAKWSVACFAVIVLGYVGWGVVENRRLHATLAAIAERGEPTTARAAGPMPIGAGAEADRLYRAAGILASSYGTEIVGSFSQRVMAARRANEWPAALIAEVAAVVEKHADTLRLADRAADLPFEGFRDPSPLSRQGLYQLQNLSGLRAIVRAYADDAPGAAAALYTEVRVARAASERSSFRAIANDVASVASRSRLPKDALLKIAAQVWDADHDDVLKRSDLDQRAGLIDYSHDTVIRPQHLEDWLVQPVRTRRLNAQLRTFDALIPEAELPWPDRIDQFIEAGVAPTWMPFRRPDEPRKYLETTAWQIGEELAVHRCLSFVLAVERYRRDHGEQLPETLDALMPAYIPSRVVDPFTGRGLLYTRDGTSYTVYSVAHDRKDNGGAIGRPMIAGSWDKADYTADVGVRVRLAR